MLDTNESFKLVAERFPHISKKIEVTWGHKECSEFINRLLTDSRDGKRQGFPPEVGKALFKLMALHDELYPLATASCNWQKNNYH